MGDRETHRRLWEENKIKDFKFSEVEENPSLHTFRIATAFMRVKWVITIITSLSQIYGFISDAMVVISVWTGSSNRIAFGFYLATVVISFYILFRELKEARLIIETDDVSDCFTNDEAFRYKISRSFDIFCLFNRIGKRMSFKDRAIKFMYFSLKDGPRLAFVRVPQFIICILVLGVAKNDKYGEQISFFLSFSLYFKIALLGLSMISLAISLLLYPFMRCFINEKFNLGEDEKLNLKSYVTFLVDEDFNAIIKEQRGTYEDDGGAAAPETDKDKLAVAVSIPLDAVGKSGTSSSTGGGDPVTSSSASLPPPEPAPYTPWADKDRDITPPVTSYHMPAATGPTLGCSACGFSFAIAPDSAPGSVFACPRCQGPVAYGAASGAAPAPMASGGASVACVSCKGTVTLGTVVRGQQFQCPYCHQLNQIG